MRRTTIFICDMSEVVKVEPPFGVVIEVGKRLNHAGLPCAVRAVVLSLIHI